MAAKFNKLLRMTDDDKQDFKQAKDCHICDEKYGEKIRVRDHCHITGKYRGPAHQDRNLELRINPKEMKIPVIFHNLLGDDSHFIMQEIGDIGKSNNIDINCIPNNMERYMAFILSKHLLFMDSFQFIASSLEKLAANLLADAFKYTSTAFQNEKLQRTKQKRDCSYDFMDSVEKFDDQQLPSKDDFYSQLNNEHISDEQYQHAEKICSTFELKNMGQYHDLYLIRVTSYCLLMCSRISGIHVCSTIN